ncbi:hypothetical protein D1872_138490 [compost metagenome]
MKRNPHLGSQIVIHGPRQRHIGCPCLQLLQLCRRTKLKPYFPSCPPTILEIIQSTIINDIPIIQHNDARAQRFNILQIMGCQQNSGPVFTVHVLQKLANFGLHHNIKSNGRLVQKNNGRIVQQSSYQLTTHPLSKAKLAYRAT